MPTRDKLNSANVRHASPGKYSDGAGLWLHKRSDGGGQWFLRFTIHRRRREMGLGGTSDVSLKEARQVAEKWRAVVREGKDPIKERERQRREASRLDNTLRIVAEDAFEARKAELKGDGKAGRWFSPLELHVLPKLGNIPVEDIDQHDIRNVLRPLWHTKSETARKALGRLHLVLRHAAALGLDVDLQATDKAQALLGKTRQVRQHIPSLAWHDVPEFYASLSEPTITHLALRMLILTGVRSRPLRFMRSDQVECDVWTIPATEMKGRLGSTEDFRVPLSTEAQEVMELAKPHSRDGYLFPSVRKGVISDATMSRLMERRGLAARPHGFRTSLRTWLAETTDAPHEVAETVLGHAVDNAIVRTYRRTDYLEQRRVLMERWADHVTGGSGKVVKLA